MRKRGFTLVEMLVVIGIIVLMVAMAVPILGVLKGNRSVEGAENQVAAVLGISRAEAMELQRVRGLLFIQDGSGRDSMVLVEASAPQTGDVAGIDLYLDLVPDRDPALLPVGITAHVVNGGTDRYLGPSKMTDRYLGPGKTEGITPTIPVGGVILFDKTGQLVSLQYAFRNGYASTAGRAWSEMGKLLYPNEDWTKDALVDIVPNTNPLRRSQFGLVLFDRELFTNATEGKTNLQKYDWIDNNAIPLLVNRYNGTLIRGE